MNLQEKTEVRTICMDGDSIDITFRFDEQWQVWIGDHPFFKEEPRYTPSGRPWTNAVYNECPHHGGNKNNDCGTCPHFRKQNPTDLIGVCFNDKVSLRRRMQYEREQVYRESLIRTDKPKQKGACVCTLYFLQSDNFKFRAIGS